MDYKNTNPAVIKRMLSKMDKDTFIHHAKSINNLYVSVVPTPYNLNYLGKLSNLYRFCVITYKKRFKR